MAHECEHVPYQYASHYEEMRLCCVTLVATICLECHKVTDIAASEEAAKRPRHAARRKKALSQ